MKYQGEYKELVERIQHCGIQYATGENWGREIEGTDIILMEAADTIETLLKERDAMVKLLKGNCDACKHKNKGLHDSPCEHCTCNFGMSDYWEFAISQENE